MQTFLSARYDLEKVVLKTVSGKLDHDYDMSLPTEKFQKLFDDIVSGCFIVPRSRFEESQLSDSGPYPDNRPDTYIAQCVV
uniref:Uncharacterized protein n=1 Tax=Romanomermis culicivorax TaxID=13658 RepID=A0A915KDL7_ROMCU